MKKNNYLWCLLGVLLFTLNACKKKSNKSIITTTKVDTAVIATKDKTEMEKRPKGFLLASQRTFIVDDAPVATYNVEYYDFQKKAVQKTSLNFNSRSVSNMLQYGNKIYVTIYPGNERLAGGNRYSGYEYTNPGYLLVLNAKTFQVIKNIPMANPRAIVAYNGSVFVDDYGFLSSSDKKYIAASEEDKKGYLEKIDTTTLNVTAKYKLGLQPSYMSLIGSKLYVANTRNYSTDTYGVLSVLDLSQQEPTVSEIKLGIDGIRGMKTEPGTQKLWISSDGNFINNPSGPRTKMYRFDLQTSTIDQTLNVSVRSSYDFSKNHMIYYKEGRPGKLEMFDLKTNAVSGFTPSVSIEGDIEDIMRDDKTGVYDIIGNDDDTSIIYFFDENEKFIGSFNNTIKCNDFNGLYIY